MQLTKTISLRNYRLAGDIAAYIRHCSRTGDMDAVSVDRLTKKFTISATPLKNAFKQRYKQTVHGYVISQRIQYICELLDTSNYSTKEIAYKIYRCVTYTIPQAGIERTVSGGTVWLTNIIIIRACFYSRKKCILAVDLKSLNNNYDNCRYTKKGSSWQEHPPF